MDSPMALAKFLLPQVPSLSYAAFQHTLGFTPTSKKWDLRTELTVKVLREMMSGGGGSKNVPPISKVQAATLREPGKKGKTWVADATMTKPPVEDEEEGTGLRNVVFQAIEDMAPNKESLRYTKPDLEDIGVEWTGYRPNAGKDEPLPDISEEEKYRRLMNEPCRTSDVTILYFHGGAYYLCDPRMPGYRVLTSRLAKESAGRVCSVRYRLAPQTAFPGQLLDAFQVYLSLLYPPTGSLHTAVSPEKIIFAGDSAGGNLSFALLQLLLQMHRSSSGVPLVRFYGKDVHVPLPGGASTNSGWLDISRSMPSIVSNAGFDYLPPPNHNDAVSFFPSDPKGIWPANPPRGDLFCDLSLLDHPLVSPILAASWEMSPPLWMCAGDEMLADESRIVAKRATEQGVKIQFEKYEAMPHCFQLLIPSLPNSVRCIRSWGHWAKDCAEGKKMQTKGCWIPARKGEEEKELDVRAMECVNWEEAKRLVGVSKDKRLKGFEKEGKIMPKPAL